MGPRAIGPTAIRLLRIDNALHRQCGFVIQSYHPMQCKGRPKAGIMDFNDNMIEIGEIAFPPELVFNKPGRMNQRRVILLHPALK